MNFSQLVTFGPAAGIEAVPLYQSTIGWLATSIGLLAVLTMLPTMERVAAARTREARRSWTLAGATAMAIGICAMFYSTITHNVIVEKHGGTIRVESTPGTGTTFIIRLPLAVPDTETQAESDSDNEAA